MAPNDDINMPMDDALIAEIASATADEPLIALVYGKSGKEYVLYKPGISKNEMTMVNPAYPRQKCARYPAPNGPCVIHLLSPTGFYIPLPGRPCTENCVSLLDTDYEP